MIVKKIKDCYGHAKIDCCNERCSLRVDTGQNFVMLKGELLVKARPERMCDCIVFQDDKKISIIELKGTSLDVSKIKDKFTNSGKAAVRIARCCGSDNVSLFMVLLAKSYKNYSDRERIRRTRIKVHGQKYPIWTKTCGASLSEITR